MTELDAARERHVKGAEPRLCRHDPLNWPCDTRVVLDALDEAVSEGAAIAYEMRSADLRQAIRERDAACALADELAVTLCWVTGDHYPEAHDDPVHLGEFIFTGFCDECAGDWPCETERRIRPALAKWEASRVK